MAEQALRPAVVNRKVWGGNRTWNGASHQERLMTVLRTTRQQHRDPITILADLLRTPRGRRSTRPTRACLSPLNKYRLVMPR